MNKNRKHQISKKRVKESSYPKIAKKIRKSKDKKKISKNKQDIKGIVEETIKEFSKSVNVSPKKPKVSKPHKRSPKRDTQYKIKNCQKIKEQRKISLLKKNQEKEKNKKKRLGRKLYFDKRDFREVRHPDIITC